MNISIALINEQTITTHKAQIIAEAVSPEEFKRLAQEKGFTIWKRDQTITGFYFSNPNGDALVSLPSFHKLNSEIDYFSVPQINL